MIFNTAKRTFTKMIRKLKKKWKFFGLILLSAWINVYLYLRIPEDNISSPKAENVTVRPSWKEIHWMQKFKRLEALYMSQSKTLIGPGKSIKTSIIITFVAKLHVVLLQDVFPAITCI